MFRIGLTGGIASGKSRVASVLGGFGAAVITADDVAREQAVPGGPVLERLASEFGRSILKADGTLDRARLGRMAFSSKEHLRRLNEITSPPLVEEILRRVEALERERPRGVVVVDAALLIDWDIADAFDLVVAVRAPVEVRVRRLVSGGMDERAARDRIDAQMDDGALAAAADAVIENAGSLEELDRKVRDLWESIVRGTEGEER